MQTSDLFSTWNSGIADDIASSTSKKRVAEGYYTAIVRSNEVHTNDKGTTMFKATLSLLRDPNDANSALKRDYKLYVAFPNGSHSENAQAFMWRKVTEFVQAFELDGVIPAPKMIDGKLTFNGSTINPAEEKSARRQAAESAIEGAKRLLENPAEVNDAVILVKLSYEKDKESGNFILNDKGFLQDRIEWVGADLPSGQSLVDPSEVFVA